MNRDIALLYEQIRNIFPFNLLPEDSLVVFIRECELIDLLPGIRIYSKGELADKMFIILDGTVKNTAIIKKIRHNKYCQEQW